MKKMSNEPWFGKKNVGWGLSPRTWQGWTVTGILILVIILDFLYFGRSTTSVIIFIAAILVFILITILTGEKPGVKQ